MTYYHDTIATPVGPFTAAVDETGALLATAFTLHEAAPWFPALAATGRTPRHAPGRLEAVRVQITEYFAGARRDFTLPLAPFAGTPHQRRVWAALREIPHGETLTYGALAKRLASSPRAVGRANATNLIPLLIPCHRVIGADGALTGFAYGLALKRRLLDHEHALPAPLPMPE
jgi:methylated-DNA-[protein]-cysteine S-methyltransferase